MKEPTLQELEEQLYILKQEHKSSKDSFRREKMLGSLSSETHLKYLATTILEQKNQIDSLEKQINNSNIKNDVNSITKLNQQSEVLPSTIKSKNPIIDWFKKMYNKITQPSVNNYKKIYDQEIEEVQKREYDEYRRIANSIPTSKHTQFTDTLSFDNKVDYSSKDILKSEESKMKKNKETQIKKEDTELAL